MYKRISNISLVGIFLLGLYSCDEDMPEESDVAVFVYPESSEEVVVSAGDKQIYKCDLYTKHSYVRQLKVRSTDPLSGETVLLDTTFTESVSSCNFVYVAPLIDRDSINVTLTFNAWDNEGNKCEVNRKLTVKSKQVLIGEKSGIVLYSSASGFPDALCFSDPSQTFSWENSADSVKADMFIETETFENVNLRSKTIAKFVRNNSFDYAAASSLSIQAVYVGSVRVDNIDDLRINDIVLVGHGSNAEGVFRVANVIRTGTDSERCLQIAFKSVANYQ